MALYNYVCKNANKKIPKQQVLYIINYGHREAEQKSEIIQITNIKITRQFQKFALIKQENLNSGSCSLYDFAKDAEV